MTAQTTDTQARVVAILADQARRAPEGIAPQDRLADLGIDSMALVETIFAIEEEFDISVPFNANTPGQGALDVSTVAGVVATVDALRAARG